MGIANTYDILPDVLVHIHTVLHCSDQANPSFLSVYHYCMAIQIKILLPNES